MSEFRKFCIGFFAAVGIASAAVNHHLVGPTAELNSPIGVLVAAMAAGAIVVAMFGDRK